MEIQEMSVEEINAVSGGNTTAGAWMTLGAGAMGAAGTVLTFTPLAAIGGVLIIGGLGIGALAYAYDMASDANGGGGKNTGHPPPCNAR